MFCVVFRFDRTYTKQSRDEFLRGSLNDVSRHPLGSNEQQDSTLRRSRSLAIARATADIFHIPTKHSSQQQPPPHRRRSQLIPRAKLVDKSTFKDRRYHQNNENSSKKLKNHQSLPKPIPSINSGNHQSANGYKTTTIDQPQDILVAYPQLINFPSINCSEIDSLDSNYHNKSSFQSVYQVSQENLHYNDLGLSLPNYYPDSKYDTDISITAENISIYSDTDFYDGNSRSLPNYAYEYDSSLSDLEPKYYESNTFNPIFSEVDYQSVSDSCSELNNFDEITVVNNRNRDDYSSYNSLKSTEDKECYDKELDLNGDDKISIASSKTSTLKANQTENSSYLKNETIENISNSPIRQQEDFDEIKIDESVHPVHKSPDHITLITIDDNKSSTSNSYSTPEPKKLKLETKLFKKSKSPTDSKKQNYLKELLDNNSNRKPLKNFIAKNISRAFGDKEHSSKKLSKLISTEPFVSTLAENQYHSLPDINASKYLQKCEKIDRKLRKCDKLARTKSNIDDSKNRFVVNIGHHFNIPNQNGKIPIDFEVKISKVPKIQKTPNKSYSFSGRNTTSVILNEDDSKSINNRQRTFSFNQKDETKLLNLSTITKQTKEKFLSGFKKNSETKSQEQAKIKPLPKITEVLEKKEQDCEIKIDKQPKKPKRKTIRNFTKIDEKPENKYNSYSCSELDSLEYLNSEQPTSLLSEFTDETNTDSEKNQLTKMNSPKNNEDDKRSSSTSPVQEYQEKLGTMRCFWDKMINKANSDDSDKSENKTEYDNSEKEREEENHLNSDIIHESPPPKVTISRFENMKEQNSQSKRPEPCKIVDVQSKVENVRKIFEPNQNQQDKTPLSSPSLVETNRKIFEPRLSEKFEDKMGTFVKDSCGIFENPYFERFSSVSPSCTTSDSSNQFESLNPNTVEIIESEKQAKETKENINNLRKSPVELDSHTKTLNERNKTKPTTALLKSKSFFTGPEFDHVRYKVMKSDLFQKNIFANYEKETQFDGLMQYLQDYSFQELLIDNNIVIIEPIRTKVEFADTPKKTKKITQLLPKPITSDIDKDTKQSVMRRHFFYHPIQVNREVNDAELPNPDTVKQVRKLFESTGMMKKSQSHNEIDNPPKKKTIRYQTIIDPDRDHCSESDTYSEKSNVDSGLVEDNGLESLASDNTCCNNQYISEDVLQKIRECGTCITYYGGKILEANNNKDNPLTKAIMEEIQGTLKRNEECACRKRDNDNNKTDNKKQVHFSNCKVVEEKITFKTIENTSNKEVYQGIKFKLIKSNSCSSRLELVGTENVSEYRKKFLEKQKQAIDAQNLKNQQLLNGNHDKIESIEEVKENSANETDKFTKELENSDKMEKSSELHTVEESPKIVAEEKKLNGNISQWNGTKNEKNEIQTVKEYSSHYIDYKDYEKIRRTTHKFNDIEFESYEVLEN